MMNFRLNYKIKKMNKISNIEKNYNFILMK